MRVLLIFPPIEKLVELSGCHTVINDIMGLYPPLGLLYIAAYLKENSDHSVMVIDFSAEGITSKNLPERIKELNPDVVGITVSTHFLLDAINTARQVKKVNPEIPVVLGGPHVNLYPIETIKFPEVDYAISGEGEISFTDLINCISKGEKPYNVKGIFFQENGQVINIGQREPIRDLDELPFPDRSLIPYKKYTYVLGKDKLITTMMTSRGCPFHCAFCYRSMGRKPRFRSAKNVVDEIEACVDLGIKEIFMFDDNFLIRKKRVHEICDLIVDRGLDIDWAIRARVPDINDEILMSLKKAGCTRIQCGVETSSNEMLRLIKKKITIEKIRHAFRLMKQHGFITYADFMIGLPSETKEDVIRTINFAKQLDPDYIQLSIFTPLPDTEFYKLGFEKEIIENDYWREFATSPSTEFEMRTWEENLTKEELIELQRAGYRQFYLRPSKLFKTLFKTRTFNELEIKVKSGLKFLFSS